MNKNGIRLLIRYILNAPLLTWVLIGFLTSYFLFFLRPIFFSTHVMQFFNYVPATNPIGLDLQQMLSYSRSWFSDGQTPYIGNNLYPPLASVLFVPFLILKFSHSYKLITLISVFCFIVLTFVLPLHASGRKQELSLLTFIFTTGLFSYGFQFELERGQFNVIAVFICFLAIWIYHNFDKYRCVAYVLFTISVQLKVFPLIFIVAFIADWHDWKNNIKRFTGLSVANFALFFILGPHVFFDFVKAIKAQSINPYVWIGNHSIHSFVTFISTSGEHKWSWVNPYAGFVLAVVTVISIFIIMLQAYRKNQGGINSTLLLACTVGSLLIPSVSHDYKLSILVAPVAFLFTSENFRKGIPPRPRMRVVFIVLLLIFSAAYSSILFPLTNKPLFLQNSLPALVTMLVSLTLLSLVSGESD